MANDPLYANDGTRLEARFQLVVPVDTTADTELVAVKNDPARSPPVDKAEADDVPVIAEKAKRPPLERTFTPAVPALRINDIVELAVADTDNALFVLVAIPPMLDATFRKEFIVGATVKAVIAVLVDAV